MYDRNLTCICYKIVPAPLNVVGAGFDIARLTAIRLNLPTNSSLETQNPSWDTSILTVIAVLPLST